MMPTSSEPQPALPAAGQTAGHLAFKSPAQAGGRAKASRKTMAAPAKAAPKGKATPKAKLAPKAEVAPKAKVAPKAEAAAKAAVARPVQAAQPVKKAGKPSKPAKAGKPPKLRSKPVRDSFTMPEADFALIATLKARALAARRETKKSELLRAGLHALAGMEQAALMAALGQLEPVKIGRPKKGH